MKPTLQRPPEALVIMLSCIYFYNQPGYSGAVFVACFFLPDLSILVYFKSPRFGAIIYNTAHFMLLPSLIGVYALVSGQAVALQVALLWASHIAFDRALDRGLKYEDSFLSTDMGGKSLPIDTRILR